MIEESVNQAEEPADIKSYSTLGRWKQRQLVCLNYPSSWFTQNATPYPTIPIDVVNSGAQS